MSDKHFSSAEDKGNATLRFSDTLLNIKVGISYVSITFLYIKSYDEE